MLRKNRSVKILVLIAALGLVVGFIAIHQVTGLRPLQAAAQLTRIAVAWVGSIVYSSELESPDAVNAADARGQTRATSPALILERPDAPHLVALRERYQLDNVITGADDEYQAQLRLASWVGSQFEHGTDEVPGGRQVCQPVAVVEAGNQGAKFWCEVAAYTMIHSATALRWPARMITLSTDGYTWEHAVAEVWSTRFNKWYVVDTDFNVVFETDGRPLSAWELVHEGENLRAANKLTIRRFAKFKRGLVEQDLLALYQYAHADFRSDWCSRPLHRGSPAGGDLNTRRTARPSMRPILTAIPEASGRAEFEPSPPFIVRRNPGDKTDR